MPPQIQDLTKPAGLQTTVNSRYTDTYVPKQANYVAPDRQDFGRLAQALQGLEPSLNRFAMQMSDVDMEKKLSEGEDLFNQNQKSWKDFVTANPDYTGANPHLVRGYKAAALRSQGRQYETELMLQLQQSGAINDENPQAVSDFISGFTDQWHKGNIPDNEDKVLLHENLNPLIQQAQAKAQNFYIGHRIEENVYKASDNLGQLVGSNIENKLADFSIDWSHSVQRGEALKALGAQITADTNAMIASGLPASKANMAVVDAVVAAAQAHKDSTILDLLDHVQTGTGVLGGTSVAKLKREATANSIFNLEREKTSWAHTTEEWERKRQGDAVLRGLIPKVLSDPNADFSQDEIKLGAINPALVDSLTSLRHSIVQTRTFAFPETQETLNNYNVYLGKALSGKMTMQDVLNEIGAGRINPAHTPALLDAVNKRVEYGDQLQDSAYKQAKAEVFSLCGGKGDPEAVGFEKSDENMRALEGVHMMDALLMQKIDKFKADTKSAPSSYQLRVMVNEAVQAVQSNPRFTAQQDKGARTIETPDQVAAIKQVIPSKEDFLRLSAEYDFNRQDNKLDQVAAQTGVSLPKLVANQKALWGVQDGEFFMQQPQLPQIPAALQNYTSAINQAAAKYNVPTEAIVNTLMTESSGNPNAPDTITKDKKGNQIVHRGMGQFDLRTAAELGIDPRNPFQAIDGVGKYLSQLKNQFGGDSYALAHAAYNWGMGNVQSWLDNPQRAMRMIPKETRDYLMKTVGQSGIDELRNMSADKADKPWTWEHAAMGAAALTAGLVGAKKLGPQLLERTGLMKAAAPAVEEGAAKGVVGKMGTQMTEAELRASEQIPAFIRKKLSDEEYTVLSNYLSRQAEGGAHFEPSNAEIKVLRKYFGAQHDMHAELLKQEAERSATKALPPGETPPLALPAGQGFDLVPPSARRDLPVPSTAMPMGEAPKVLYPQGIPGSERYMAHDLYDALPAGKPTAGALPAGAPRPGELAAGHSPAALPSGEKAALPAGAQQTMLPAGQGFEMVPDGMRPDRLPVPSQIDHPEFVNAYMTYLQWAEKRSGDRSMLKFAQRFPYAANVIDSYFKHIKP